MAYATPGQIKLGEGDEYELRPPGAPIYNVSDAKEAAIVGWRAACFERLGFQSLTALAMATRRDIDREQVKNLISVGATPVQVADILL